MARQLARVGREEASVIDPEIEQRLSKTLGYFNGLENSADGLFLLIPLVEDKHVLQIRLYARALGHVGWRLEAAADAEILSRIKARLGGRGVKDEDGEGRMAAYKEAGKAAGCHEDTIQRNVQIYETFLAPGVPETVLACQERLREKAYCEEALRTKEPHKMLIEFDARKQQDYKFNTSDARKLARGGDPQAERHRRLPAIDKFLLDAEKAQLWEAWLVSTMALRKAIPPLTNALSDAIKSCREQLARPEETLEKRMLAFMREGPGPTCELLADQLRHDRYKVQGVLDRLLEEGVIRAVKQVDDKTKLVASRGATPLIYFINQKPEGEGDRGMWISERDTDDWK